MGSGFLESVKKWLLNELEKVGLPVESRKSIKVHYGNEIVGRFIADINCE